MKTIQMRHTLKALNSNFELAVIFGIVITAADFMWLLHDLLTNGLSWIYATIGCGLLTGLVGSIWVLVRHNSLLVKKLDHELLEKKLKLIKHVMKHKKLK